MRGKVVLDCAREINSRITPAYAGKRNIEFSKRIKQQGSPPPMRGKVYSFGNVKDQVGITPAYAGKSPAVSRSFSLSRDHPRLCGEKSIKFSSSEM